MQEKFAICLQIFWKAVFLVGTNPYLITKILHTSLYMSSTSLSANIFRRYPHARSALTARRGAVNDRRSKSQWFFGGH